MRQILLLFLIVSIAACGPTDRAESGAITNAAEDAKTARTAAQDAAAAAEAAARKVELLTRPPAPED